MCRKAFRPCASIIPPDRCTITPEQIIRPAAAIDADRPRPSRAKPATDLPLAEVRIAGTSLALASDQGWTLGMGEFTLGLRADPALGDAGYELGFDLAPLTPDPAFVAALQQLLAGPPPPPRPAVPAGPAG